MNNKQSRFHRIFCFPLVRGLRRASLLIIAGCLFITDIEAANPVKRTIRFGGFEREYLVYTPQHPQSMNPDGILIGLHGFNGSMDDFFDEYDFRSTADAMNYLILAPQALPEQSESVKEKASTLNSLTGNKLSLDAVWACGLRVRATLIVTLLNEELNKDVDDVGFISHIIQQILDEYALPTENIFMVGTSMGGYMAYQYALKQPVKLAGMVSVAGSMGLAIKNDNLKIKVPICDFHSLTDEVVPYAGSFVQSGITIRLAQSKADVIKFWATNNETGTQVKETINYYPSANNITVEKNTYPDPVNEVIHYQINGASHNYFFKKEKGDCMDHLEEITKFITAHAEGLPTKNDPIQSQQITVYPNPARDVIYFGMENGAIQIYNLAGQAVWVGAFNAGSLNIAFLPSGNYILHIQSEGKTATAKIIKE